MASHNLKIHEQCTVAPPSAPQTSLPLVFFDLFWLRFHPVERIFFYSLPVTHSNPSIFFAQVVPKLKNSLSHTLQHFSPLAGNVLWPHGSSNPVVQYNPGDAVSVVLAESEADFDHALDNAPKDASESRCLVPHLESSDSHASVMALQITLFPNRGFAIGITTHHAVLDGKSSTLFIKAWASLCKTNDDYSESSPSLAPELEPFFDRTVIKSPSELGFDLEIDLAEMLTKLFPSENSDGRCLKLLPFPPRLEEHVRGTFVLTGPDLERIKNRVLSKWDSVDIVEAESNSKPTKLSTFVLTCAYTFVCIAKAWHRVEKEKNKFASGFTMDCRARLEPPIPENYFGNCVWGSMVDAKPSAFLEEEGLVNIAKSTHSKIKEMLDKGVFHGIGNAAPRYAALAKEGVELFGIAGSNRFGVYENDFGWGKPSKVEIASVDRAITIGLAENRDEKVGVEIGIVLKRPVMELFATLFRGGLSDE
ncbi:malonyl-CoA:anthocyanidin 5-O-glucoside-6''-O-malonyltransferase-like [Vigna umbellata]|uniref:malonyl-CoA:anthocyanidin 5-O-glucoside-6''-O-malonyltransferase-like n=1 Tax=Vigna umbellata TaxID=87088 RepID=UPI001F5FDD42|nr:malonyl-CoA:anthocyanidin 5-O-glucoside-6''-O-malonyltransferase-like [Vigna umbellata]